MRCLLYLRVSTDEQAASAEEQERGALAWCGRNNCEVVATLRDVGVSGAEWVNRPGLRELERQAKLSPRPFDVVVVRDADRLGRDTFRLPLFVATLRERGVRVVAWSTGEELAVEGATAKLMLMVKAWVAESAREQIAHVTRTALKSRAERGMVTGGRVYGYRNVRGHDGVRYVVDAQQAEVVLELFRRRAAGEGSRTIASSLNARNVPAPFAGGVASGAWSPSGVVYITGNPRYRGVATFGRSGSKYVEGSRVEVVRDDSQVITYPVEPIVSEDLWHAAQANTAKARAAAGAHVHRGRAAKYLLIGNAVCGACGGPLGSANTSRGAGADRTRTTAYMCLRARDQRTCDRRWCRPVERFDGPVIDWLLSAVLAPDVVGDAIEASRARVRATAAAGPDPREAEARARVEDLERRIGMLVRALERDDGPEVFEALRVRRAELAAARRELEALAVPAPVISTADADVLLARLADLRPVVDAARGERPDLVRAVLRTVLVRPILVNSRGTSRGLPIDVEAEAAPGALLNLRIDAAGQVVQGAPGLAGGSAHRLPPQFAQHTHTPDAGYAQSPVGAFTGAARG